MSDIHSTHFGGATPYLLYECRECPRVRQVEWSTVGAAQDMCVFLPRHLGQIITVISIGNCRISSTPNPVSTVIFNMSDLAALECVHAARIAQSFDASAIAFFSLWYLYDLHIS